MQIWRRRILCSLLRYKHCGLCGRLGSNTLRDRAPYDLSQQEWKVVWSNHDLRRLGSSNISTVSRLPGLFMSSQILSALGRLSPLGLASSGQERRTRSIYRRSSSTILPNKLTASVISISSELQTVRKRTIYLTQGDCPRSIPLSQMAVLSAEVR